MSSNSALIDSQQAQAGTQATSVNRSQFKSTLNPHSKRTSAYNHLSASQSSSILDKITSNAFSDLPDILAEHKPANGNSIKDSIMFNSFFPLNMNDSIKEEANDTLTREELELNQDSDDNDEEEQTRQVIKDEKDIEDGEIVDNDDDHDDEDEDEELSSSDELSRPKQRTGGSHDDQESCGSDDEYVEESDYQSQSPTSPASNRSNISSDQSEGPESP